MSLLSNVQRNLAWSDFGQPRQSEDPAPGTVATGAKTRATHQHSMNVELVPGSRPHAFRLQDTVNVSVILQQAQMFVNDWVFRQPQQFQDDLLHHEQGHYDLVALFCRDMFIDMVAIRSQTFPNPNAVLTAVTQVMNRYDRFIAGVHDLYDNDAQHGRNAAQQQRWDGFIQAALNNPRTPPATMPDGTAAKAQLFDVLRAGGVVL